MNLGTGTALRGMRNNGRGLQCGPGSSVKAAPAAPGSQVKAVLLLLRLTTLPQL
jgi:hypothetical protein